jgi:hypothetical protein
MLASMWMALTNFTFQQRMFFVNRVRMHHPLRVLPSLDICRHRLILNGALSGRTLTDPSL